MSDRIKEQPSVSYYSISDEYSVVEAAPPGDFVPTELDLRLERLRSHARTLGFTSLLDASLAEASVANEPS